MSAALNSGTKRAYAAGTKTSITASEAEIRKLLRKYGAENFGIGEGQNKAQVMFEMADRRIIIRMPLPPRASPEFVQMHVPGSRGRRQQERPPEAATALWEQACRTKWRALLLVIRAKLEGVESGVETIEQAFMAHMVMPSGETMGEWVEREDVKRLLAAGKMPPLLGGPA